MVTDTGPAPSAPLSIPTGLANAESTLTKAEWQSVLFPDLPRRSELLKLKADWPRQDTRIRVHRNHSFEHVASVMVPYLAFADWQAEFKYSDYDDSLTIDRAGDAEIEVVWLDFERFEKRLAGSELSAWLADRVLNIRGLTPAPILVMNWDDTTSLTDLFNSEFENLIRSIPGVRLCDRRPIRRQLGEHYFDERAAALSGTRLSDRACILTARELASHWIPAVLRPRLKAIVLDLDNTLYSGVLGEDGPEALSLTEEHQALQAKLLEFNNQGIFLALVSKNEPADVERMFAIRQDFPLRWNHFSAHAISWSEKPAGLVKVAEALRIGVDSIVFVDDNPGELASVSASLPGIHTVLAGPDPNLTARTLMFYPGLWTSTAGETDAVRIADLNASKERERLLAETADPAAYFKSLQVKLTFQVNPRSQIQRLAELSGKTNQFNLNLRRLTETELEACLASPECRVVSIRLSDRLSDSGIIGLVVGRRQADTLVVEEVCVSCRALGRRLETVMLGEALRLILNDLPGRRVCFLYRSAPRNDPARAWLASLTGESLRPLEGSVEAPESFGRSVTFDYPIELALEAAVGGQ